MGGSFDAYHVWLGIPPSLEPPSCYRLLGLDEFEGDAEVIESAADRQAAYLRSLRDGDHGEVAARLLKEVSAARVCLLSPDKKAAYDQMLRERLARARAQQRPAAASQESAPAAASKPSGPPPLPPRSHTGLWIAAVGGGVFAFLALTGGIWYALAGKQSVATASGGAATATTAPRGDEPTGRGQSGQAGEPASRASAGRVADGPSPPVTAVASEPDTRAFAEQLERARAALSRRDVDAAFGALAGARQLAADEGLRQELLQVETVYELVKQFWLAVHTATGELRPSDPLPVGRGIVEFGGTEGEVVMLRAGGQELRYTTVDMPAPIAVALAMRKLGQGTPTAYAVCGAFLAVDPQADRGQGRRWLAMAASSGRPVVAAEREIESWWLDKPTGGPESMMLTVAGTAPAAGNAAAAGVAAAAAEPTAAPVAPLPPAVPAARSVDLPPRGAAARAIELLALGNEAEGALSLRLLNVSESPTAPRFTLREMADAGAATAWDVVLHAPGSGGDGQAGQTAAGATVARIERRDRSLAFVWSAVDGAAEAEALRNCVLMVSAASGGQTPLLLRTPVVQQAAPLELNKDSISLALPVEHAPESQWLQLEVVDLQDFPDKTRIEPETRRVGFREDLRIILAEKRSTAPGAELRLRLVSQRKGLQVVIEPVIVDVDDKTLPLTVSRINTMYTSLNRQILAEKNQLGAFEARSVALGNEISQISRMSTTDNVTASVRAATLNRLNAELRRVNGEIVRLRQSIPVLERRLKVLPGLADAGNQVHEVSRIMVRVFHEASGTEVDLYRTE